jgi:hypothetical protein
MPVYDSGAGGKLMQRENGPWRRCQRPEKHTPQHTAVGRENEAVCSRGTRTPHGATSGARSMFMLQSGA